MRGRGRELDVLRGHLIVGGGRRCPRPGSGRDRHDRRHWPLDDAASNDQAHSSCPVWGQMCHRAVSWFGGRRSLTTRVKLERCRWREVRPWRPMLLVLTKKVVRASFMAHLLLVSMTAEVSERQMPRLCALSPGRGRREQSAYIGLTPGGSARRSPWRD